MDTLHTVLSSISGETRAKSQHLTVFREFLAHLEKIQHKAPLRAAAAKPARVRSSRRKTKRAK